MTGPFLESLEPRVLLSSADPFSDAESTVLGSGVRSVVVVIGDVDGDGADDVLASNDYRIQRGRTTFFHFGASVFSGRTGETLFDYRSFVDDVIPGRGELGAGLAALGDVNFDGVPDFAISNPDSFGGQVFVLSGADGSLIRVHEGVVGTYRYGNVIAGLGDIDGDGAADLGIGHIGSLDGDTGRILAFSGATGELIYEVIGPERIQDGALGHSLAPVDDVNADGVGDWISGLGEIFSGADGVSILSLERASGFGGLSQYASIGDVDGDGISDIVHHSRFGDAIETFSGATGSLISSVSIEKGGAMAVVGDVDGDGTVDVAIGVPDAEFGRLDKLNRTRTVGAVYVYSGVTGETIDVLTNRQALVDRSDFVFRNKLGTGVAAGDVTGDGVIDILATAAQEGHYFEPTGPGLLHRFRGLDPNATPDLPDGLAAGAASGFVVTRNDAGHIVVHERGETGWVTFTVLDSRGEPVVVDRAEIETLVDSSGRYIAYIHDDAMHVLARERAAWVPQQVKRGDAVSDLTAARAPTGRAAFGAINGDGQVVQISLAQDGSWRGVNASKRASVLGNEATPIVSHLTYFGSPWGAAHYAGLSASGQIAAVWKAPNARWGATIISPETSLESLAATSTVQGELHLAGVDGDGQVVNVWWKPGESWRQRVLNDRVASSDAFAGDVQIFSTPWAVSIVGVTAGGEVSSYYKVRGRAWRFDTMSLRVTNDDGRASALINGLAVSDGMEIYAFDATGSAFLYRWSQGQGSTWLVDRLA